MYKLYSNSAIGRGRPTTTDIIKAADGLPTSFRNFSISSGRNEDRDNRGPSRGQKSSEALKEVSSLVRRPSRGIDARSLAAKPTKGFTVTRVDKDFGQNPRLQSSGRGPSAFRGGLGRGGASRGGLMRSQGRGGGGVRGGRGRARGGRGRGAGRPKPPKREKEEPDSGIMVFEPDVQRELNTIEGGITLPYNPQTSAETQARWVPAISATAKSLSDAAINKIRVATGSHPYWETPTHLHKIAKGLGTMYETTAHRESVEAFMKTSSEQEKTDALGAQFGLGKRIVQPSDADKDALNKQWIAGQYDGPTQTLPGDILGQALSNVRRNGTYLAEDSRQLEMTLRSLLPVANTAPKGGLARKSA